MSLQQLSLDKQHIESQLDSLIEALDSQGVDMNTPLVIDGFPRNDIDIPQIRQIRAQIIRLRNDLKHTMNRIAEEITREFNRNSGDSAGALQDVSHAQAQSSSGHSSSGHGSHAYSSHAYSSHNYTNGGGGNTNIAFAYVREVFENSPASSAGLLQGDHIVKFGEANALNHNKLSRLSTIVQTQREVEIHVKRRREREGSSSEIMTIVNLQPDANWGGRGALGCHIVPL